MLNQISVYFWNEDSGTLKFGNSAMGSATELKATSAVDLWERMPIGPSGPTGATL
jgi:hypothetical protein